MSVTNSTDGFSVSRNERPLKQALMPTAGDQIAQWIAEIEASNSLRIDESLSEHKRKIRLNNMTKRRLQRILDAINETRCEGTKPNA
jgi:hypothetical protein